MIEPKAPEASEYGEGESENVARGRFARMI